MEPVFSQGNRFCNEITLCFTRLLLQVKPLDLNVKLALQNVTGIYSTGEYSPGCFSELQRRKNLVLISQQAWMKENAC